MRQQPIRNIGQATGPDVDHVLVPHGRKLLGRVRIGKSGAKIGRHSSCDLVLCSGQAPPVAAKVERKSDGYYVIASGPDVNLKVNGRPVLQEKILEGDTISIGDEAFSYKRAARSRVFLIPLLSILVLALATLGIAYRFSGSYYRSLALKEFEQGNSQALEEYIEQGIVSDVEEVLADEEVMDAADQMFAEEPEPEPEPEPVREVTLEDRVKLVMMGFGIREPVLDEWSLSRVERWVKLFTENKTLRRYAQKAMQRSTGVSDMMITKLRASALPEYLVFLSFAESNFNASIKSHAGAVGLWQFMPGTGRDYNLYERTDPVRSTDAAIAFLTDLTAIFGSDSILMAMAAYNCGGGNVRRCLRRSVADPYSERSFWHLSRTGCLPEETQEYVPKILALGVIGNWPELYGFTVPDNYQLNQLKPKFAGDTMIERDQGSLEPVADGG